MPNLLKDQTILAVLLDRRLTSALPWAATDAKDSIKLAKASAGHFVLVFHAYTLAALQVSPRRARP